MSEMDRVIGQIETTMSHFGDSLDEAKIMIRESSEATGELRVEVAKGLTRVQEKQSAQATETDRRFGVVDERLDKTNRKADGVRTDLADHEKLEAAGEAHGMTASHGRTAAVGAGGAAGLVGVWAILQRAWEWIVTMSQPPTGGH